MSYRKSKEIAPEVLHYEDRPESPTPTTANEGPFHLGSLSEILHEACWNGDVEKLRELLDNREAKHFQKINECDSGGQNLLHLVAFWGNLEVAEVLVDYQIDVNALNIMQQRPLDVAMQWGNIDIADLIRNNGGKSMFETRIEMLENTINVLRSELAESREMYRLEKELRIKTEGERDFWIESAHMVQKKWVGAFTDNIISQAKGTEVQSQLFKTAKKRDELNSNWADATQWAAGADFAAKRLWSRMRVAEESKRAAYETVCMAMEEKRVALIDREVALEVRNQSIRLVADAEKSLEVAERSSREAQALAKRMVPYKKKSFQLMRKMGMRKMQKSMKSVFEMCPPKILDGAIATLSYLCEDENSPALPKIDTTPGRSAVKTASAASSKRTGRRNTSVSNDAAAVGRPLTTPTDSENFDVSSWDFASAEGRERSEIRSPPRHLRVGTAPARSGDLIGTHTDEMTSKQRHINARSRRPTTAENGGSGIFRRMFESVRMPQTQVEEDYRRSKGERHRMGLPPEVPFDLLVLDPYGKGVEVLTCTHVRNDSKGFQRLKVTHKKEAADAKTARRIFEEKDMLRKMEWVALQADMRAKEAEKQCKKRERYAKPLSQDSGDKLQWGEGIEVKKLDNWQHADEIQKEERKVKLARAKVEKGRLKDKHNDSDDESEVKPRALNWQTAILD
jgi:hypothetical protein